MATNQIKRGKEGFPEESTAQAKAWWWETARGVVGGCSQHGGHLGKSEKRGREHIPSSLVSVGKELGLARKTRLGRM